MLLNNTWKVGLTLLQSMDDDGPMTFTLTFPPTVRHRNMERTVLCIQPPLWKEKERPSILLSIPVFGRPPPTYLMVWTKLSLHLPRLLTLAVTVSIPGLKTTLPGLKLIPLWRRWQVCL